MRRTDGRTDGWAKSACQTDALTGWMAAGTFVQLFACTPLGNLPVERTDADERKGREGRKEEVIRFSSREPSCMYGRARTVPTQAASQVRNPPDRPTDRPEGGVN